MKRLFVLFVLVTTACGDNHPLATPDAGGSNAPPTDAPSTPRTVIAAPPANFTPPGILSELDVASQRVTQNLVAGVVGGDPIAELRNGMLYIVNRDVNNVTIIDASTLAYVNQIATGIGSNPQDVAVVGDKLYVPAMGTAGVVVLSQSTSTITKTIDLNSAVGETDGKPNCVAAYTVGTDVYVACELLDDTMMDLPPKGDGQVAVIDSTTDTVRTTLALPAPNPQAEFTALPDGDLMIAAQSFSDQADGCIVRITPGSTPVATCQIDNGALNGTSLHMALKPAPGPVLWLAVESFDGSTSTLSTWDVLDATVTNSLSAPGEVIQDVAACPDGSVVAADATMNATGFRVFSGTTELTTKPLPFGEPPGFGNGMVCYDP